MKVWERRNTRRTKKKGCSTVILLQMTHRRKSTGICSWILYPTWGRAADMPILVSSKPEEQTQSKLLALSARSIWIVIWIQGSPTIGISTVSRCPTAHQLRSGLTFPTIAKQEKLTTELASPMHLGRYWVKEEQPNLGRRNLTYLT